MRLAIFGKNGQVARALAARAQDAVIWGRDSVDLVNAQRVADVIEQAHPDAVINAAAWTAVDAAETERAAAFAVNAEAPAAMAGATAALGIPLVHISTDYVFDGSGDRPWRPDDTPSPLSVYGASKLAGEKAIRAAGGVHAILRTAWVFSPGGENFVNSMLRLAATRNQLRIVADQVGGPTPADAIAQTCLVMAKALIANPRLSGTYHLSGTPEISWADFARAIFARSGHSVAIEDIPSGDYPTVAVRPRNSRLNCSSLTDTFGIERPDWSEALDDMLKTANPHSQ